MGWLDDIKNTLDAGKDAALAPAGVLWDVSTAAFDDDDDSIGKILGHRGKQFLRPVLDPATVTGMAVGEAVDAANWALDNVVNRPISTLALAGHHADAGGDVNPFEKLVFGQDISALFDADTWRQAWETSDTVNAGQAIAGHALAATVDREQTGEVWDPFDYEDPYDERTKKDHPFAAPTLSWGMNIAGAWYADPFALAGKGVGAARMYGQGRFGAGRLTTAQRATLGNRLLTQGAREASRADRLTGFIRGNNTLGRHLTASEIEATVMKVDRWGRDPHKVSQWLADAARIEDPAESAYAVKQILAVGAGDPGAIARLEAQLSNPVLLDGAKNLQRGNVLDLEMQAANQLLGSNPLFQARLQKQIDNLGSSEGWNQLTDKFLAETKDLLSARGTLGIVPAPATGSRAALLRGKEIGEDASVREKVFGQGLGRAGANAHRAVDEVVDKGVQRVDSWAKRRADRLSSGEGASMFLQRGSTYVPVLAAHTAGSLSKAALNATIGTATKFPVKAADALRTTHFVGYADLDDWEGSLKQLDAAMSIGHVDEATRRGLLDGAMRAKNEAEKGMWVERAERAAVKGMVDRYNSRNPLRKNINADYVTELYNSWAQSRKVTLGTAQSRAYSGVDAPEGSIDIARARNAERVNDAATKEVASKRFTADAGEGEIRLRADQILDESGAPLALPLYETQLATRVPMLDLNMMNTLMKRDTSLLSNLSHAWARNADREKDLLSRLGRTKGRAADAIRKELELTAAAKDTLMFAGQKASRWWKMSVLFRLGYPVRVVLDDHARIYARIGAATFWADNVPEGAKNVAYNRLPAFLGGGRRATEKELRKQDERLLGDLLAQRDTDRYLGYEERMSELKQLQRSATGHRKHRDKLASRKAGTLTDEMLDENTARLQAEVFEMENRLSKIDPSTDEYKKLQRQIANRRGRMTSEQRFFDDAFVGDELTRQEGLVADREAAIAHLQDMMGDGPSPREIEAEIAAVKERLVKNDYRPAQRRVGESDIDVQGLAAPGAFAGRGGLFRSKAGSAEVNDRLLNDVEDSMYRSHHSGGYRTVERGNPGYFEGLADLLNRQIRYSPVAMHFVKGGTVDEFVKWVKAPDQAALRDRLPHWTHSDDAIEDWGERVVRDIENLMSDPVATKVAKGERVTTRDLKRVPEAELPLTIHAAATADNLGVSGRALGVGTVMSKTFNWIATQPTDRLSRHPFFNSMYKMHMDELVSVRKIAAQNEGKAFAIDAKELHALAGEARSQALSDLRKTLFDMTAHSHAAHVMRFLSPFFAAHQEVITRWWRIVKDNPGALRRIQQVYDVPRQAGIVVDRNGDPVEPGAPLSPEHSYIIPEKVAKVLTLGIADEPLVINENSLNLIMPGGNPMNPGAGPMVSVPAEALVAAYPEEKDIEAVARMFNPYPPSSPAAAAFPATFKRAFAVLYGTTGNDVMGIGRAEFDDALKQNTTDMLVKFRLEHGRDPNGPESEALRKDAQHQAIIDSWMRLGQNATSPFPARPASDYAAQQQGWYRLMEQGRTRYPDSFPDAREWALEKFKEKYGDTYLPLTRSDSSNAAILAGSPGEVAAFKRHKDLIHSLDPRLAPMVIGMEGELNGYGEERSYAAVNFFRDQKTGVGSDDTFFGSDSPAEFFDEQLASSGWEQYEALTAGLQAAAQQAGFTSYLDSPEMVEARKQGLALLKEQNPAFAAQMDQIDTGSYDRYLADMETLAATVTDVDRSDIATLRQYLQVRSAFDQIFEQRLAAGLGGPDAESSEPIRQLYSQAVGILVESNTYFEKYMFNTVISRDPLLMGN